MRGSSHEQLKPRNEPPPPMYDEVAVETVFKDPPTIVE